MSTKEIVVTTCDKCGAHAPDTPIVLGLGGQWKELDLCDTHRASFDTRVAVWFALASRVPVTPPAPPRRRGRRTGPAAEAPPRRGSRPPTTVAVAFTEAVADR